MKGIEKVKSKRSRAILVSLEPTGSECRPEVPQYRGWLRDLALELSHERHLC